MLRHFSSAIAIVVSAAAISLPASAQTLSAADILAKVDEKVAGQNEFQALLNDPDANRSMAAMEAMLESGDPKLVRMALDFGLYSPNPVVQRMALDGFFASGPDLKIYFAGDEAAKNSYYRRRIEGDMRGSVDSQGIGFISVLVGSYNKEKRCYVFASSMEECALSLTDFGVSLTILRQKGSLQLNDAGELRGEISLPNVAAPVSVRIPVSN